MGASHKAHDLNFPGRCDISMTSRKEVAVKTKSVVFVAFILLLAAPFWSAPPEMPTISQMTAGMKTFPGFFPFYWDGKTGKIWLEIDKFDEEFLYFSSLSAGLGSNDIGLDRNQLGRTRILFFHRVGPKILLIQPNYGFQASSDNPAERKAVEDAFAKGAFWGFEAAAEEGGRVLVDASAFFLRDVHNAAGSLARRGQTPFRSDPTRSAFYLPNTKNFPRNTEIEAMITLVSSGGASSPLIRGVAADPDAIMLRMHHSLVRLPDDGYERRMHDPRSNFGAVSVVDYAMPFDQSITQRFIRRHRLAKKDPRARISEPIEPIVYYVDRAAPEPIRSALVEGASWWNAAFEAAGYKNAFQVKVLPEGADPLDIRYNMINWVHRSTRGWSYGSSVTDPRTGEILKGHVALGSLRIRQDYLIAEALVGDYEEGKDNAAEMREMALARIRQLSCHEVGHTLGMGHNYGSNVNDRASVMDYPHPLIKISEDGTLDLSDAYTVGIGEWDKVSVAYGYQDFPPGVDEATELGKILDGAFARGLVFLAGQDAGPASASPMAASWANGKDPVDELERVMNVRSIALANFSEKRIRPGVPMATLEDVLVPAYFFHRFQTEAAASVLGGQNYFHKLRGDVQKNPEIVAAADQRRALDVLLKTIDPDFLALDPKLVGMIPPRPPGYRETAELIPGRTGQTFDPLGAAEAAAGWTIGLILHPVRASRLVTQHALQPDCPALGEVIDALISATWMSGSESSYRAEILRVVDIAFLTRLMGLAVDDDAAPQARAVALLKIAELEAWMAKKKEEETDEKRKAHVLFGLSQIEQFKRNPQAFQLTPPLALPPGAPIGTWDRQP